MVSYSQLHFCLFPPGHTQVCLRVHGTINNHSDYKYKPWYCMSMNCCLPTDHLWTQRMEGPKELICCTGKNSKHLPMLVTTICSLSVHSGTSRINTVYRIITTKVVSGQDIKRHPMLSTLCLTLILPITQIMEIILAEGMEFL